MTNAGCQLAGFIIAAIGGTCVLLATILPHWRRNGPSKETLEMSSIYEGIWIECIAYSTGQWQCTDINTFFVGLPLPVQIGRGFSCTAVVLGALAFVFSVLGMECTSCLSSSPTSKQKMSLLAGVMWVLSGGLMGVAVSYYANSVLNQYRRDVDRTVEGEKFIFGSCLYVGWAALVTCSVGGSLLAAGSRSDDDEQNISYLSTAYRPPGIPNKADFSTEYV